MADGTLDSELFYLLDRLPGYPNPLLTTPVGGFTATACHNVATAAYPIGTKIQVYNVTAGAAGYSTFVYGKLAAQDATNILAPRHFCTTFATTPVPFEFTNEVATYIGAAVSPAVVALSAMTTARYGWFWCAGVCPEDYVAALGGNYYAMTDTAIGPVTLAELSTPGTTAGEIGLDLVDADTELVVGVALAADTAA